MSQSIQITFPTKYVNAVPVDVDLILDFNNHNQYPDIVPYPSSHFRIAIQQYGNISLKYDMDNYILVPSDISMTFTDYNSEILTRIESYPDLDLQFKLRIKINNIEKFYGTHIDESLQYNEGSKELSLTFSTDINKVTEITLYDKNNNALNPLNYDLVAYNSMAQNEDDALKTVQDAVTDILKLIDPEIQVTFKHDWQFGGITPDNRNYVFSSLRVQLTTWYDEPEDGERLLGDLLKSVAKSFFSQIVIISNKVAYFRKLYYYNTNNLQTVNVKNRIIGYGYHRIKYVNSKNTFGTNDGAILYEFPNAEAYTEVSEDVLSFQHLWDAYYVYKLGFNGFEWCRFAKDPIWANEAQYYFNMEQLPAKLAYYYRGKKKFNRVDHFTLYGINYDYAQNFNYDNTKYQILNMDIDLVAGLTEIDAIYLGVL